MVFAFTSFAAQSAEPPVPVGQRQARSPNGLQGAATHPHTLSAPVSQTSVPEPQPGLQSPEPLLIDLAGALQRARNYHQEFLSAGTASALAREDRIQAKAALLPTLNAFNQFIYTQGNGTPSGVFVANDGVHVYGEQAVAHAELFPFARRAEYQRAQWAEAAAKARQDIAARGLVATVVDNYYTLIIAQRHETNARQTLDEAKTFLDITGKQERGGEVARADVIKAQIQFQQRQRDVIEAEASTRKARLGLGVILFADMAQPFNISDDVRPDAALPPSEEIRTQVLAGSPQLRAAEAGFHQAETNISVARAAYIPTLSVDYFYGINANVFGVRGPDGRQNLGSVVQGTVNLPVWNWGSTRSKVRQARLQKRQAELELSFAQRNLQSSLNLFYLEAQTARTQLDSLRTSTELSRESLRLTTLRYQGGEATALEVVDAQSTLAQARDAYDGGMVRYRVALARLQTLAGGL
jgi:outer membrane protein